MRQQQTDEHAIDQLCRRFRPGLMAFFLRRVGNQAEAEDLTQEVFLRLASAGTGHMQTAESYIFRIAVNLLRDRGRREKVRSDHRAEALADSDAGIDLLDPMRVAAGRESLAGLSAGLRELPELTRTIFVLYRLESVDKRDIAHAFDISPSTLERHLARAMLHLSRRVKEQT